MGTRKGRIYKKNEKESNRQCLLQLLAAEGDRLTALVEELVNLGDEEFKERIRELSRNNELRRGGCRLSINHRCAAPYAQIDSDESMQTSPTEGDREYPPQDVFNSVPESLANERQPQARTAAAGSKRPRDSSLEHLMPEVPAKRSWRANLQRFWQLLQGQRSRVELFQACDGALKALKSRSCRESFLHIRIWLELLGNLPHAWPLLRRITTTVRDDQFADIPSLPVEVTEGEWRRQWGQLNLAAEENASAVELGDAAHSQVDFLLDEIKHMQRTLEHLVSDILRVTVDGEFVEQFHAAWSHEQIKNIYDRLRPADLVNCQRALQALRDERYGEFLLRIGPFLRRLKGEEICLGSDLRWLTRRLAVDVDDLVIHWPREDEDAQKKCNRQWRAIAEAAYEFQAAVALSPGFNNGRKLPRFDKSREAKIEQLREFVQLRKEQDKGGLIRELLCNYPHQLGVKHMEALLEKLDELMPTDKDWVSVYKLRQRLLEPHRNEGKMIATNDEIVFLCDFRRQLLALHKNDKANFPTINDLTTLCELRQRLLALHENDKTKFPTIDELITLYVVQHDLRQRASALHQNQEVGNPEEKELLSLYELLSVLYRNMRLVHQSDKDTQLRYGERKYREDALFGDTEDDEAPFFLPSKDEELFQQMFDHVSQKSREHEDLEAEHQQLKLKHESLKMECQRLQRSPPGKAEEGSDEPVDVEHEQKTLTHQDQIHLLHGLQQGFESEEVRDSLINRYDADRVASDSTKIVLNKLRERSIRTGQRPHTTSHSELPELLRNFEELGDLAEQVDKQEKDMTSSAMIIRINNALQVAISRGEELQKVLKDLDTSTKWSRQAESPQPPEDAGSTDQWQHCVDLVKGLTEWTGSILASDTTGLGLREKVDSWRFDSEGLQQHKIHVDDHLKALVGILPNHAERTFEEPQDQHETLPTLESVRSRVEHLAMRLRDAETCSGRCAAQIKLVHGAIRGVLYEREFQSLGKGELASNPDMLRRLQTLERGAQESDDGVFQGLLSQVLEQKQAIDQIKAGEERLREQFMLLGRVVESEGPDLLTAVQRLLGWAESSQNVISVVKDDPILSDAVRHKPTAEVGQLLYTYLSQQKSELEAARTETNAAALLRAIDVELAQVPWFREADLPRRPEDAVGVGQWGQLVNFVKRLRVWAQEVLDSNEAGLSLEEVVGKSEKRRSGHDDGQPPGDLVHYPIATRSELCEVPEPVDIVMQIEDSNMHLNRVHTYNIPGDLKRDVLWCYQLITGNSTCSEGTISLLDAVREMCRFIHRVSEILEPNPTMDDTVAQVSRQLEEMQQLRQHKERTDIHRGKMVSLLSLSSGEEPPSEEPHDQLDQIQRAVEDLVEQSEKEKGAYDAMIRDPDVDRFILQGKGPVTCLEDLSRILKQYCSDNESWRNDLYDMAGKALAIGHTAEDGVTPPTSIPDALEVISSALKDLVILSEMIVQIVRETSRVIWFQRKELPVPSTKRHDEWKRAAEVVTRICHCMSGLPKDGDPYAQPEDIFKRWAADSKTWQQRKKIAEADEKCLKTLREILNTRMGRATSSELSDPIQDTNRLVDELRTAERDFQHMIDRPRIRDALGQRPRSNARVFGESLCDYLSEQQTTSEITRSEKAQLDQELQCCRSHMAALHETLTSTSPAATGSTHREPQNLRVTEEALKCFSSRVENLVSELEATKKCKSEVLAQIKLLPGVIHGVLHEDEPHRLNLDTDLIRNLEALTAGGVRFRALLDDIVDQRQDIDRMRREKAQLRQRWTDLGFVFDSETPDLIPSIMRQLEIAKRDSDAFTAMTNDREISSVIKDEAVTDVGRFRQVLCKYLTEQKSELKAARKTQIAASLSRYLKDIANEVSQVRWFKERDSRCAPNEADDVERGRALVGFIADIRKWAQGVVRSAGCEHSLEQTVQVWAASSQRSSSRAMELLESVVTAAGIPGCDLHKVQGIDECFQYVEQVMKTLLAEGRSLEEERSALRATVDQLQSRIADLGSRGEPFSEASHVRELRRFYNETVFYFRNDVKGITRGLFQTTEGNAEAIYTVYDNVRCNMKEFANEVDRLVSRHPQTLVRESRDPVSVLREVCCGMDGILRLAGPASSVDDAVERIRRDRQDRTELNSKLRAIHRLVALQDETTVGGDSKELVIQIEVALQTLLEQRKQAESEYEALLREPVISAALFAELPVTGLADFRSKLCAYLSKIDTSDNPLDKNYGEWRDHARVLVEMAQGVQVNKPTLSSPVAVRSISEALNTISEALKDRDAFAQLLAQIADSTSRIECFQHNAYPNIFAGAPQFDKWKRSAEEVKRICDCIASTCGDEEITLSLEVLLGKWSSDSRELDRYRKRATEYLRSFAKMMSESTVSTRTQPQCCEVDLTFDQVEQMIAALVSEHADIHGKLEVFSKENLEKSRQLSRRTAQIKLLHGSVHGFADEEESHSLSEQAGVQSASHSTMQWAADASFRALLEDARDLQRLRGFFDMISACFREDVPHGRGGKANPSGEYAKNVCKTYEDARRKVVEIRDEVVRLVRLHPSALGVPSYISYDWDLVAAVRKICCTLNELLLLSGTTNLTDVIRHMGPDLRELEKLRTQRRVLESDLNRVKESLQLTEEATGAEPHKLLSGIADAFRTLQRRADRTQSDFVRQEGQLSECKSQCLQFKQKVDELDIALRSKSAENMQLVGRIRELWAMSSATHTVPRATGRWNGLKPGWLGSGVWSAKEVSNPTTNINDVLEAMSTTMRELSSDSRELQCHRARTTEHLQSTMALLAELTPGRPQPYDTQPTFENLDQELKRFLDAHKRLQADLQAVLTRASDSTRGSLPGPQSSSLAAQPARVAEQRNDMEDKFTQIHQSLQAITKAIDNTSIANRSGSTPGFLAELGAILKVELREQRLSESSIEDIVRPCFTSRDMSTTVHLLVSSMQAQLECSVRESISTHIRAQTSSRAAGVDPSAWAVKNEQRPAPSSGLLAQKQVACRESIVFGNKQRPFIRFTSTVTRKSVYIICLIDYGESVPYEDLLKDCSAEVAAHNARVMYEEWQQDVATGQTRLKEQSLPELLAFEDCKVHNWDTRGLSFKYWFRGESPETHSKTLSGYKMKDWHAAHVLQKMRDAVSNWKKENTPPTNDPKYLTGEQ